MDYPELECLIAITKKGDASKEKKEEYFKNMLALLSKEGYGTNSEKYLFGGFSFCGASPVFEFLKKLKNTERFDIVTKITKGKMYGKNEKGISLKVMIHLLSFFIVFFPDDISVIDMLVHHIPYKAKTKSNTIIKDLPSILERYFISEIKADTIFPDFRTIAKERESRIEFYVLVSNGLKDINTTNSDALQIISKVLEWLENEAMEDDKKYVSITQSKQQIQPDKQKTKEKCNINMLSRLTETFQGALKYISGLEEDLSVFKKDKSKIEEEYSKLKTANEKIILEIAKLQNDIYILKDDNSSKEKENFLLKAEVEKQKSVLSIYSSDKQNSLNEQLNVIASKLKTHYLNYNDAVGMRMTVELGENLKNLIGDIFRTLAKSGVDVERKM
jgi:cell division protein FtsB